MRAFAGLWIGALLPSVNILVSEYSSDARRGTAMGIYGIGLPLGAATGGFISTFLIGAWGWRAPFWFATILTVVLLFAAWRWVPESILYLVEKHPPNGLQTYNRIADQLGYEHATELPAAYSAKAGKVAVSTLFHGVLARRTTLLWIGFFCQYASFYFANTWTPKLLSDATSDATLGVRAGVLVSVGGVVGALVFAWLATRVHPRVLTAGLAFFFGLVTFGLYANYFGTPTMALTLALAVGFTTNGGNAAYYAISPPVYPTRARATGVGWMIGIGRDRVHHRSRGGRIPARGGHAAAPACIGSSAWSSPLAGSWSTSCTAATAVTKRTPTRSSPRWPRHAATVTR